MNSCITLMITEHENINRMNMVIRNICIDIMEGKEVPISDLYGIIDFIRNYADKHHHGKEEKYLFPKMIEKMGVIAEKLITNGMLVEHDLGRSHVMALEVSLKEYEKHPTPELKLDVITEAMGYAHLLQIHTEKESNVVYPFSEKNLSTEDFSDINEKSTEFENNQSQIGIQEKYLSFLKSMEEKYQR